MKRSVTLVLGSGVAWGIAYAGVLQALDEMDIEVRALGGTSMGALVGGLYAAGLGPERLCSITADIDTIQMARIFIPTLPHGGIIRNEGVRKFLKDIAGDPNIEDLDLPFFCPATDIETGEEIVFREGSLVEAIISSISIPLFFQPNRYRDRFLVDGGLVDPLPVEYADREFDDPVLGITVIPDTIRKQEKSPGGLIPFLEKLTPRERGDFLTRILQDTRKRAEAPGMFEVMSGMILVSNREVIRHIDRNLLENRVVQLDLSAFSLFDFLKGRDIAEAGYEQTLKQKDRIIRMVDTATS